MSAAATGEQPPAVQVAAEDDEPPPRRPSVVVSDERTAADPEVRIDELAGLLADVLAAEGVPASAEAAVSFVEPDHIATLKAEHFDGDGAPTDVLSFPVDGAAADAELVGDVVICPAVAAQQAPGHAGNLDDELRLLVVHGGLHLTGWDHAEPEEQARMWARERELLERFGHRLARDPWAHSDHQSSPAPGAAR